MMGEAIWILQPTVIGGSLGVKCRIADTIQISALFE
jgi:hypothetical protein